MVIEYIFDKHNEETGLYGQTITNKGLLNLTSALFLFMHLLSDFCWYEIAQSNSKLPKK